MKFKELLANRNRVPAPKTADTTTNDPLDQLYSDVASLTVAIVIGEDRVHSYTAVCTIVREENSATDGNTKSILFFACTDSLSDEQQQLLDVLFPKEVKDTLHLEPGGIVRIYEPWQEFRFTSESTPILLCTKCTVVSDPSRPNPTDESKYKVFPIAAPTLEERLAIAVVLLSCS